MPGFNYAAPAELFTSAGFRSRRGPVKYHRFATGAEAIQYAIEVLPAELLEHSILEVDEGRFEGREIRDLYDSLPVRRARKS